MANTVHQNWETALTNLNSADASDLTAVHAKKDELFALNSDDVRKIPGRIIHDDHRIVLSAPEIIIGDVNLGGILSPTGKGKIIIRGRDIAVESTGDAGSIGMRAPKITQIAEDPGVDGMEHDVKDTSQIVSQARGIVLQSDDVPANGAFRAPKAAENGGIVMHAEKTVQVVAQKSWTAIQAELDAEIANITTQKGNIETEVNNNMTAFKKLREEFDKISEKREKLVNEEEDTLRVDYRDLDELNILLDEMGMQLSKNLYEHSLKIAELKGLVRKIDSLKAQKDAVKAAAADVNKFKENPTGTSVTIASETVSISSTDGDGNIRTTDGAGVTVASNDVKIQSSSDDTGSLEASGQMSVNMRNVLITTASQKVEAGKPEHIEYKSEGDVVITSKNIKLQTVNSEVDGDKFIDKGLAEDSKIIIRSNSVNLSTVNTTGYESQDDGKPKNCTYTPAGKISLYTKDILVDSIERKIENGAFKTTDIVKGSNITIRNENFHVNATDKDGKSTGSIILNAKNIDVRAADIDPKSGEVKKAAEGGTVQVGGEKSGIYGEKKILLVSKEDFNIIAKKKLSLRGDDTAELKQGKGLLTISGGDTTLSGGKNTLHGDTTINVLQSPSITGDNVTISKALKAPNFTDSIMVDTKNKSGASAKIDDSEDEKNDPNKNLKITGAVVSDDENKKLSTAKAEEAPTDQGMHHKMDRRGRKKKKKNK